MSYQTPQEKTARGEVQMDEIGPWLQQTAPSSRSHRPPAAVESEVTLFPYAHYDRWDKATIRGLVPFQNLLSIKTESY
jgi:hypothetical protein